MPGPLERGSNNPIVRRGGSQNLYRDPERGHAGDNVQVSATSLPTHPTLPPLIRSSATKPAQLGPRSGSTSGSRDEGGATPPSVGRRRPNPGRRLSPAGRRSPLAAVRGRRADTWHRQLSSEPIRPCSTSATPGCLLVSLFQARRQDITSAMGDNGFGQSVRPIGTTLAPNPGAYGRAQQRQAFARSRAAPGRTGATLTQLPRAR